jgi:hypothetical protein
MRNKGKNNSVIGSTTPKKHGIDPETNYFLKQAKRLAELQTETQTQALYLLHNGNYAVHTTFSSLIKGDSLERIDRLRAAEHFKIAAL